MRALGLLLVVALAGCAARAPLPPARLDGTELRMCPNFQPRVVAPAGLREFRFPEVGATYTAEVGRAMMVSADVGVYPQSLVLPKPYRFPGEGRSNKVTADIPAGEYAAALDGSKMFEAPGVPLRYKATGEPVPNSRVGLLAPLPNVDLLNFYLFIGTGSRQHESGLTDFRIRYCLAPHIRGSRLSTELVYTGQAQGFATVIYREYSNDIARPAFTQELRYDLSAGGEVGFRGARFIIERATNTEITFKVVRPLD